MSLENGEKLTQRLQFNLANRETTSRFDFMGETEALLQSIGASLSETG